MSYIMFLTHIGDSQGKTRRNSKKKVANIEKTEY